MGGSKNGPYHGISFLSLGIAFQIVSTIFCIYFWILVLLVLILILDANNLDPAPLGGRRV